MKLLLINPKFPESFWSFSWSLDKVARDKKTINPPLGLLTVAALTPSNWEITIMDENVEPIDWDFEADIVGVCGMQVQFARQKEILNRFRGSDHYVVAGGSYASLCPEAYRDLVDTVIAGESEYIWPQFCADFEKGAAKALYHEKGVVSLEKSLPPRYELAKPHLYTHATLQFSRGCPFQCEFCDIIIMFGRKPRTKSLYQVEQELDMLRSQGIREVFFVDDNMIGHLPAVKKLLAFLADYQKKHNYRFIFGTEASINMASDHKLMQLFKEANFSWVFIGIESPNEEALLETKKEQNTRQDLLTSIRTIYSYGIDVLAGFIVGFDADDLTIFDRQYKFIIESGIVVSMIGLLVAIPKTPLFERLDKSNRLNDSFAMDNTGTLTNVIPLNMRYNELIDGYSDLLWRLNEEKAIYRRIQNKLSYLNNPVTDTNLPLRQQLLYVWRFLVQGIILGGHRRWYFFARSLLLALKRPKNVSVIIANWILGISHKTFVEKRIKRDPLNAPNLGYPNSKEVPVT